MKITDGRLRLAASDVANFLACPHLTRLDLLRAHGGLRPPQAYDIGFQELISRGEAHEQDVLGRFRAAGHEIVTIGDGPDAETAKATARAMGRGADIIYQGVLLAGPGAGDPALLGRPDFLIRAGLLADPDGPAAGGPPGGLPAAPATAVPRPATAGPRYEVVDAKLARSAKARAVVQTAFYSHLLAAAQGAAPRWMHLALGNGEFARFKVAGYAAYERQIRRVLTAVVAAGPGQNPPDDPYPEPVEHCAICRWSEFCAGRRRRDDDLSLIAGMPKGQRRALKAAGITTRRGFAGLGPLPDLARAGRASLQRAQQQARLQVASEDDGQIRYELLDPERDARGALLANRGLLALPEASPGDLFFDIEGARYYSEDGSEFGLQYLFGIVDSADRDGHGTPRYHQIWAFDRPGEKQAFEDLVDFITARRRRHPGLHVYHYNHYEPTSLDHLTELHETRQEAVGRLMGRFATREDEVDDLFRLGVFVDLYRVVRQGLRAGVESYSIKRLEPLCGYGRQVDLRAATLSLIEFEAGLEDGTARADLGRQRVVAGYNEDDCRATLALRDWLEERRHDLAGLLGEELPRPVAAAEPAAREDPEVTRIRSALLAGLPADPAARTAGQRAQALLADLLDWHRREAKPVWWRYFYLRTLSSDELTGEPDAIGGLTGGEVIGHVKRSQVHRFRFPPQEHRLGEGDSVFDPVTGKAWAIHALDELRGQLDLRCGRDYAGPLPSALVAGGPVDTRVLAARLRDLGARVAGGGLTVAGAATALLLGLRPDGDGSVAGPLRGPDEPAPAAAARLVTGLRDSYLPIQGPPGTGKTHNAAGQILGLLARGRTVGITGPSHAVISHLIGQVLAQ
ncbi:MAG TPA: TM0106 family RecB-like putative nuclease, partial [Streptosporangiaceae bacterium]